MRRIFPLVVFLLLLALPAWALGQTRALLVACRDFLTLPDLGNSVSGNLHIVGSALVGAGLNLGSLSIEDGTIGTVRHLQSAVDDAFGDADETDLSILYLCTHGVLSSSDDGQVYLMLGDGENEAPLGAAALLSLMLTVLCGAAARRNMDRLGVALAAGTVLAAFVLAQEMLGSAKIPLTELLAPKKAESVLGWTTVASDALWGVGAVGLVAFPHRALAAEREKAMRRGGRIGTAAIALLTLLCAGAGLLGRAADATLESRTAAETMLIQIGTMESLPKPLSAVLTAGLTSALLLSAGAMMTEVGSIAAWDIALPLTGETREKPLMRTAMGAAALSAVLAFVLALDPNRPLQDYALAGLLLSTVTAAFLWA